MLTLIFAHLLGMIFLWVSIFELDTQNYQESWLVKVGYEGKNWKP